MRVLSIILVFGIVFSSCKSDEPEMCCGPDFIPYFPPYSGEWATTDPMELGWNSDSIEQLYTTLENNDTRAFMVLKDGKIVLEKYWGKEIIGNRDFNDASVWYWASAAKTLTSYMVGQAQSDGYLTIQDKTSDYLGEGWTSLTKEQEDKITIWHQLTMTSGLNDLRLNPDDFDPSALTYREDAGTRWAYHNAPYTLLEKVVANASEKDFNTYFEDELADPLGMTGSWQWSGDNHLYFSNARSAARFGLFMQHGGLWDNASLMNETFAQESINPSQELNKSYGYLWWLNGSESYRLPQSQLQFPGMLLPQAPSDVYSAMGKNGQYISISPSNGLVIVRLGDNPSEALVPLLFLNDIWGMLTNAMN